ncbi:molybdopterin-guanine dinucleotide biosynthesis protein B [Bacillus sp. PS06]|uniref:molybdopterin-guanine dinucleotide biosynthesis protein B n=1 Tax=Bacillus sp. PS06 TaxID=2764176 RepID=UPI00177FA4BF|nr:molybdopterin-guanine dinucleotide biosynthesis protein B [Bacillus sp. PS06]MBD8067562.1 molybdopterin-guanine dinucleotide biosynthesis protein B [Bacillus sp. PS06]
MGIKIPIVQVIGYQNSGKTTLIEKIIEELSSDGCKIGTIKHHGHGGLPDISDKGKDTERHRVAGAVASSIEGNGTLQLHVSKDSWKLKEILEFYQLLDLDLIIIEGYKQASFPKVVIIREQSDLELLTTVQNIVAIVVSIPLEDTKIDLEKVAMFSMDNLQEFTDWIKYAVRDHNE